MEQEKECENVLVLFQAFACIIFANKVSMLNPESRIGTESPTHSEKVLLSYIEKRSREE